MKSRVLMTDRATSSLRPVAASLSERTSMHRPRVWSVYTPCMIRVILARKRTEWLTWARGWWEEEGEGDKAASPAQPPPPHLHEHVVDAAASHVLHECLDP